MPPGKARKGCAIVECVGTNGAQRRQFDRLQRCASAERTGAQGRHRIGRHIRQRSASVEGVNRNLRGNRKTHRCNARIFKGALSIIDRCKRFQALEIQVPRNTAAIGEETVPRNGFDEADVRRSPQRCASLIRGTGADGVPRDQRRHRFQRGALTEQHAGEIFNLIAQLHRFQGGATSEDFRTAEGYRHLFRHFDERQSRTAPKGVLARTPCSVPRE